MKMQLLRWNNANQSKGHDTTQASPNREKGLDVAGNLPPSGRRRSIFLTSPFIDQAISLIDRTMSAIAIFHQLIV
jgi:hypothetical protein